MGPQKARLYDTLEKLVPRFEEMEQALSIYSSEEKQKIIGDTIILAISSPDPIRSMNGKLEAIRKGSSVRRMINCAALSLEVPPSAAKEMLASMVI
jgi:predicted transcriptional regulator